MRGAAARRPVSRRRAFLVTLGLGWAGYGYLGIIANPAYSRSRGLQDITRHVPLSAVGWGWVAAGVIAVLAGLLANCPRVQSFGFVALAMPAALFGAAFTISAATSYEGSAGSACAWAAFAVAVLWVSGMDDPLPPHLRKRR